MIDAHHHLWQYDAAEYGWIGKGMEVLKKDFLPADLKREMDEAGIEGTVAVQARQTIQETEWLLKLAAENPFIRGVVGWVPLVDKNVGGTLERLSSNPKLRGVRHVLQDEADDRYMLRGDFQHGIAALRPFGLVYDILIFERHLPAALRLVDAHPNQTFVLDHIAKPKIKEQQMSPWRENIEQLAKRPHVYCKVSGMATEADWKQWNAALLEPYFEVVLEAFGPKRLMFGSDWPVLLLAGQYTRWANIVRAWCGLLSQAEQQRVASGTAIEAYHL
jgi:L-fuconolactonase